MRSLSDMLESVREVGSPADALELVLELLRAANALLPALPEEVVGSLHTVALAAVAYAFDVPFVSFKGERIRVFGKFVTTRTAVLALLVTFGVLAVYGWFSQEVYDLFVLTGWQAFGLVCVTASWLLLAKTHRNLDGWTAGLAIGGLCLLVVPLVG